jgi:hypothetical protein
MTNTAWAALITRLPAADDLPLNLLLELIETSNNDLNTRTGNDIARTLGPLERACCQAATALAHAQPHLTDAAGHNAAHAWATTRLTTAGNIYRRHAKDVLTEINANPFTYLHTHPTAQAHGPDQASTEQTHRPAMHPSNPHQTGGPDRGS